MNGYHEPWETSDAQILGPEGSGEVSDDPKSPESPEQFPVHRPGAARQFTVGINKGSVAVFGFALLALLLMETGIAAAAGDFVPWLTVAAALGTAMAVMMLEFKKHIDVDGDRLSVKGREFRARDIANISISKFNGAIKLYGHDGKVLARFNSAMDNAPLMMQWLKEHHIPLRG